MGKAPALCNYVNGQWCHSATTEHLDVINPASVEIIARVPVSPAQEVDEAVQRGHKAFLEWRQTPVTERAQFLFKFKRLLEDHMADMATTLTTECGKTFGESIAELRRGVENVEVACGIPTLIQGLNNEDIARGIDEHMFRQPLGVVAAITPFNFPGMIPLWFLPYAIACGNCFILKPSEKVPRTAAALYQLLEQTGLPNGVAQLIHGTKPTVDALLEHPQVRAISFVGTTAVAQSIYARATANGKRAQCQGGAKNTVIILPDADMTTTTAIAAESAFGCSGQRCLAASVAVTVGTAYEKFKQTISDAARDRRVGNGLDPGVEMGPVITAQSKARIEQIIGAGTKAGARPLVDGRGRTVPSYGNGYFIFPTVLDGVDPGGQLAQDEIFGPVLNLIRMNTLDEAIAWVNQSVYGNMACLFTNRGAAARKFRYQCDAGNLGINIGVAAPMAFYPFSGCKQSFFGDLHAQGRHGVEFYTQTKVVVERW